MERGIALLRKKRIPTLKNFLETALLPLGSTLYVWGGGWEETEGQVGVNPEWKHFFYSQGAGYEFSDYLNQGKLGLDCSGYVGWCVSNTLYSGTGKCGYVKKASTQARFFSELGFGTYREKKQVTDHCPGDIMSSEGTEGSHVYLSLGECRDGSLLILHSTPNGGVQLNGTKGRAAKLAEDCMEKYFPLWAGRYRGTCQKPSAYQKEYGQLRWRVDGNGVLHDPEEMQKMRAEEVISVLFLDRKKWLW
jgi:hypothetical protein